MAIYVHGYRACECIRDSASLVELRLREAGLIQHDLRGLISQGCYSGGVVAASAGTHNGGGVLDVKDWTPYRQDADNLFTACGWIAFYRTYGQLYAKSPAHWHIVLNGCPHLYRPDATNQLADAKAGLNALRGKGKDSGPRPWITWQQAVGTTSKPAPLAPTPTPPEDDMRDYVAAFYRVYLGREGSVAELDSWTVHAAKTTSAAGQILADISGSAEARTYAATSSYATYLGRTASAAEVAAWVKQPWDAIVAGVKGSAEASAYAKRKV